MRIAFERDGEGRAELHRRRAQVLQAADVGQRADAAGGDHRRRLDAGGTQHRECLRHRALEIAAWVVQVLDEGRTEVAAGMRRMLEHDRVRHALLALPFAHDELHAACIRENRQQRDVRVIGGEVGQVEGQAGADDDGVDAAFYRTPQVGRVFADRAHHVHRQRAAVAGDLAGAADLAVEGLEVGAASMVALAAAPTPRSRVRSIRSG